jgi:hypothetical protein
MLQNIKRKYALADFSVEYRAGKGWYYGRQLDKPATYKGPYSSIASVTLMIARKLRKEVERRDEPYALPE